MRKCKEIKKKRVKVDSHENRHPKESIKIVRNFILLRARVERVKILA